MTEKKRGFANFIVDPTKRLLLKDGKAVPLSSKAFDLLTALINRQGDVVSKEELIETIWPDQFVEESNLTVQISTLRKALGEMPGENQFIVTVPGKGYKFVGEDNPVQQAITIENHSYSQIVIEDEIEEMAYDGSLGDRRRQLTSPSKNWLSRNWILAVAIAAVSLVVAIAAFYTFRNRISPSKDLLSKFQIRQLTNKGNVRFATMSPDGKLFAYVTGQVGLETLWLGRIDGGEDTILQKPAGSEYFSLAFSPDGKQLYFTSRSGPDAVPTLFKVAAAGGSDAEQLFEAIHNFTLSIDGTQIAYPRFNRELKKDEIFVLDLASLQRRLIPLNEPTIRFSFKSLSFSPDGQRIAFGIAGPDESQRLATARIADGTIEELNSTDFGEIKNTIWSSDGNSLILTATEHHAHSSVPQFRVWSVTLPSGEARTIASDLSSYGEALRLSSSGLLTIENRRMESVWVASANDLANAKLVTAAAFGKYDGLSGLAWTMDDQIVFVASDTRNEVVSMMNADGSGRKQLSTPGSLDDHLAVSPDDKYIVFESDRGGGSDIWRMNLQGGEIIQLTFEKTASLPCISFDSKSVYYSASNGLFNILKRVPIDGGVPVAMTDKESDSCSISPDGLSFAVLYQTDKTRLATFSNEGGKPTTQYELARTASLRSSPRWAPDGKSLIYNDANFGYWKQPIQGGPPSRLEGLPEERMYDFAWSRDGTHLAFVRGQEVRDVVLFTDQK